MTSVLPEPRSLVLLGSTGSIGTQAIDVIERNRARLHQGDLGPGAATWRRSPGRLWTCRWTTSGSRLIARRRSRRRSGRRPGFRG
ncbi:hypothetical protein [Nonomuraea turcica]|uniref:hypothetical protein n=1 Tax=Nonomuraea sp. G32 TaxID=3067274 RepID=UPI003530262D